MKAGARGTLALTGATGFLGTHLARALLADGWHVRALVRGGKDVPPGAQALPGSLDDAGSLERLVAGAGAVVHAAALVKAARPADFSRVNVEGTRRLLDAVARTAAPQARVALVSSLAARAPQVSPYAASKAAAEAVAAELIPPDRLLVLRPPALYGPGDRETLAIFRAARLPLVPVPGDGRERIAVLHAADAAEAMSQLLRDGDSGGFTLADGRPDGYRMRELLAAAAAALGRPQAPRFVPVPPAALRLAGAFGTLAGRLTGRAPTLNRDKVREMLHGDWSVAPETMPPGLAQTARPLARGFAEAVAWYRQASLL